MPPKKRILTGDRPTGRLHLGHYFGTLKSRLRFQDEYENFYIIADLHTLTTKPDKQSIMKIRSHTREIVLDYLAVGIDPEKSVIFLQSQIPETYMLNLIFEMLVTVPRLERIPSLKDMARDARLQNMPFGLLGYPVLQAADILLPRAHLVPVATDNAAHVEVTREIARRFNRLYGEVFPVPQSHLCDLLVGTDVKSKASSSLGNVINISDDAEIVERKVQGMYTDPKRVRADIPGQVEGNPLFIYHEAFNHNQEEVDELKARYSKGKVGDVEVKRKLSRAINEFLEPIRERRTQFVTRASIVDDLLLHGTRRMQAEARETMALVREAMGMYTLQ